MMYFTKEFHTLEQLSYADRYIRKSKKAETYSEEFFNEVYKKRCAVYVRHEKMCDLYTDFKKELEKVDKFVNEPDISDKERAERIKLRNAYATINRERIESGKFFKFDKQFAKQKFDQSLKSKIELYENLPQEIKDKIADMRVFALGYASEEVKRLLSRYCVKLRKQIEKTEAKATNETIDAEDLLKNKIGFNELEDDIVLDIEEKNDCVYLTFTDRQIIFKNGKLIEKETNVYHYNADIPAPKYTKILYAELHTVDYNFEAHFLLSNSDRYEKQTLWYLTIGCSDINAI